MSSKTSDVVKYGFIFQNDKLLILKQTSGLRLPTFASLSSLTPHFLREYPLGIVNSAPCYCAEIDSNIPIPDDLTPTPLRQCFEILGMDWYVTTAKAISVITWDKNHEYCGRCGSKTIYKSGTFERVCEHCKLSFYPRISPSMIVLIKNRDKILMSRSPHFTPGAYGLIAGFLEVGESIEDAVHREVQEEVGLKIKNLRYFGSQSWPFPDSLMIGFTADYDSGEIVLQTNEIESADWYRYDQLPGGPSVNISIARKLIDHFIAEQQQIKKL